MQIPILSFPWNCYICNKKMDVTYPTTKDVYQTEFRGNLAPTYSKTQEEDVIGNLCPNCGKYQGNFFVQMKLIAECGYELEEYVTGFFNLELKCTKCGNELVTYTDDVFSLLQDYQHYLDFQKSILNNEEENERSIAPRGASAHSQGAAAQQGRRGTPGKCPTHTAPSSKTMSRNRPDGWQPRGI